MKINYKILTGYILIALILTTSCNTGKYYFNKRLNSGLIEEISKTSTHENLIPNEKFEKVNFQENDSNTKGTSDNLNNPECGNHDYKIISPEPQEMECVQTKRSMPPHEDSTEKVTFVNKGKVETKKTFQEPVSNKEVPPKKSISKKVENVDLILAIIGIGIVLALLFYLYSILGMLLLQLIGIILLCFLGIAVLAGIVWLIDQLIEIAGLRDFWIMNY